MPLTRGLLLAERFPLNAGDVLLFGIAFLAALALAGFYRLRLMPRHQPLLRIALLIQIALVAIASTALEHPLPRTIMLVVPLVEAIAFMIWRSLQDVIWPVQPRDTILVGNPHEIESAFAVLESAGDPRIRVIGYAGSGRANVSADWFGPLDDNNVRAAVREADEVIHASSESSPLQSRLELLRIRGPRGYLLLASPADALLISSVLGWMGDEPLIEVSVGCGFGVRAIIKRAIDIAIGSLLLAITSPLFALVAIAIRIAHGGPVLLRQPRLGLGGVPFGMFKFRSMHDDDRSHEERITLVGRFLRRYHIDELPQLLNVVAGDMSLVGPRPEQPDIAERILSELPDFDLRCLVRPGIAGLAQILAEKNSRPAVKLRYDLTYMCSWSLWLDVRLFFSSVAAALSGSGV